MTTRVADVVLAVSTAGLAVAVFGAWQELRVLRRWAVAQAVEMERFRRSILDDLNASTT